MIQYTHNANDGSNRQEFRHARCEHQDKLTFRSPARANRVRKTIKRRRGENLTVYRCQACGWWHLGHPIEAGRGRRKSTKRRRR